jgi:hypothetical protein
VFSPVPAKDHATVSGRGRQRVLGAAIRLPGLCVRLACGRRVLFGCSTWWKSLFQCTDRIIPV